MSWQPIATAPRDGTPVLLFCPDATEPSTIIAAFWEFENDPDPPTWYEFWNDVAPALDVVPTHWQPLPAPPEAET